RWLLWKYQVSAALVALAALLRGADARPPGGLADPVDGRSGGHGSWPRRRSAGAAAARGGRLLEPHLRGDRLTVSARRSYRRCRQSRGGAIAGAEYFGAERRARSRSAARDWGGIR